MNCILRKYISVVVALFICTAVFADSKYLLKGILLNSSNNPVRQASVRIPNGDGPVYSDENGYFEIEVEKGNLNWLVIRPLEKYENQYKLLQGQDSIVVYLSTKEMDSWYEDISLPNQIKDRRDIISSISAFDGRKTSEGTYSNIQHYLEGRTSGAFITSNSGMPGYGASVYIRGYSSLLTNNQPLYIVDGIPLEDNFIYDELIEGYNYDPLSVIDPHDVSEIVVLKDASETASFGMKAANGIVYINTLTPKETKTTINLSLKTGITQKPDYLQQLDAKHFKNLANELLFTSGIENSVIEEHYPGLFYETDDLENKVYNHNTNWQDEIYDNAIMQNLRFSIKGGDAIARYGLSVGYLKSEGVFKKTAMNRFNIRLVGAFDVFSWLHMNINSSLTTNTSLVKESALSGATSPVFSALAKSPMLNPYVYDSEGNLLSTIDEVKEFGISNPTAISELMNADVKNYRFFTAVNFVGDITDELKVKSVLGLNSNNLKEFLFVPDQGFGMFFNDEAYNVSKAQNSSYMGVYNDNKLTFSTKEFDNAFKFSASLGFRWQTNTYEEDWGLGKNSASDDYRYLQRGSSLIREMGGRNKNWNWASVYSNAFFSFKDKYLANISVSGDVSSRIGSNAIQTIKAGDVPVGLFYGLGGAWRISEEPFLKHAYIIDELKVRVSYGIAGNDDVGEVNGVDHYVYDHYRSTSVIVSGQVANDELTYQTKNQINLGFDVSFLANRFSLSANYFNNKSKNLLLLSDEYSSLGFDAYPSNSASLSIEGFEFDVFSRLVSKNDFYVDLNLNVTSSKTVIDEVAKGEYVYSGRGNYEIINKEGEKFNSFYGYRYLGVFSTSDEAAQANMKSNKDVPFGVGDARYDDINHDGVINDKDKVILGSFEPDFFGGLALNVHFKRWTIKSFWSGVYGNESYNYVRRQNEKMTGLSNQSVKVLQRWQYEGHETDVPKAMWNDPVGNSDFSSRWIEDGSYFRLKELTLSYDIQKEILAFNSLKLFITINNLFTLTKYHGGDPEFSYSSDVRQQGVDYGLMPVSKRFVIGVNIGL